MTMDRRFPSNDKMEGLVFGEPKISAMAGDTVESTVSVLSQ